MNGVIVTGGLRIILAVVFCLSVLPATASEADDYLCAVYNRMPVKVDSSGDFTWKDKAAAAKRDMEVCEFVIGGMNPKFRTALYKLGQRLDGLGFQWTILSAFRDDYRQSIADGFKARVGYSLHGGSHRTGGYGDGQAVDVWLTDGFGMPLDPSDLFRVIDRIGRELGVYRPMASIDPPHLQLVGSGGSVLVAHHHQARHKVRVAHKGRHKVKVARHKNKKTRLAHARLRHKRA